MSHQEPVSTCTRHIPDLSSLDGETCVCARCNVAIIGTGPYYVEQVADDGGPRRFWLMEPDESTGPIVVATLHDEAMATRIAALLNFAHEGGS